jgi:nitrogen fixation NifU-like protein
MLWLQLKNSSMFNIKELYQETILEYGTKPKNFGKLKDANFKAEVLNYLCGDKYWFYLKINQEKIIKDISFEGEGCLISKASASLMTEVLKKKTIRDAKELFKSFKKLLKEGVNNKNIGKLNVFSEIYKFPARIQCVLLPWYFIRKKF